MPSQKSWVMRDTDSCQAESLAKNLHLSPVTVKVLFNRGFQTEDQINAFLNSSLDDLIDPFRFKAMEKVVARIRQAIEKKEKILVYGDYDVDGITGSAILTPILKTLGADVEAFIPDRTRDGYGLNGESLRRLLKNKYKLVITVDNGITGVEAVDFLNEKKVDCIIIDHHQPGALLPKAYAILSAVTPDSGYPDDSLAACGLAFKLGWALLGGLKEAKSYLDLVALGTVADMAPVVGENRILIREGLSVLSSSNRPGIQALKTVAGILQRKLDYSSVGFMLGPRINATGRLGSPESAFKLLVTQNAVEAQNLAKFLNEENQRRQTMEREILHQAIEKVERDTHFGKTAVLVLDDEGWHQGVNGIIASRLMERYYRPCIVIAVREGIGKGSGRSIPNFALLDSVRECQDLLENFGGHHQALGLTIQKEKISEFREKINAHAASRLGPDQLIPRLFIDECIPLKQWTSVLLDELERVGPFGPGNPKPIFLSEGLKIKGKIKSLGKETISFWVSDPQGQRIACAFGFRMAHRLGSIGPSSGIDLVYSPSWKEFGGIESLELRLEDFR